MRRPDAPTSLLERVELGRVSGLWEGHLADGRAEAAEKLLSWMEPVAGLDVLDAGCGHGTLAIELARRGARVLACDRRFDRALSARRRARRAGQSVRVVAAEASTVAAGHRPPSTWFCWELFEHLAEDERRSLLREMEASRAEVLFFAVRVASRLGTIVGQMVGQMVGPRVEADRTASGTRAAPAPTIDPVLLLRQIHLETDLRLERTETLTRRNSVLAIAQMRRPRAGP